MTIRPYTGFCAGVMLGVLLLKEAHRRGLALRFLVAGAAACLVTLAAFLGYNLYLYGHLSSYSASGSTGRGMFVENPGDLFQSIVVRTRWSVQAVVFYAFPFALPLAAYALWRDEEQRSAAWMLTALFLGPVAGYSLVKAVSGPDFGERYYYEVYFALCLLAARGLLLLWDTRGRAAPSILSPAAILCLLVYGVHVTFYVREAAAASHPHAAVLAVSRQITEPGSVVFLPVNLGRETNGNAPRWQHAPAIYLEDPGEPLRAPVTRVLGRRTWYVIAYDADTGKGSVVRGALP